MLLFGLVYALGFGLCKRFAGVSTLKLLNAHGFDSPRGAYAPPV